ncbi:MAG: hypothetical protein HQK49_14965 [Oligoflexia bacterium]|nr:hypothetical protein [Oligoflexia bacterium]
MKQLQLNIILFILFFSNLLVFASDDLILEDRINEKKYLQIFREMKSDLSRSKDAATYAKSTIEGIEKLYKKRHFIAKISDAKKRNAYILKTTNLTPEEGFSVRKNENDRLKEIMEKVDTLVNSYKDAKKNKRLKTYFRDAFNSDPCFNGRISKLIQHITQMNNITGVLESYEVIDSKLAVKLLEEMQELKEIQKLKVTPSKDQFKKHLETKGTYDDLLKNEQKFNGIYNYVVSGM